MKRISCVVFLIALFGCQKQETVFIPHQTWLADLQTKLSATDFQSLDLTRVTKIPYPTGEVLYRIPVKEKKLTESFLLIQVNEKDALMSGEFLTFNRKANTSPLRYDGSVTYRSLKGTQSSYKIINGRILFTGSTSAKEAEPELEPVIVIGYIYHDYSFDYASWYNLLALLTRSSVNDVGWYTEMTGGSGGTYSTEPPIQIDEEHPEYKDAVDPKKYIDCFAKVPDDGGSFQITIAADIPVDSDPNNFYSFSSGSPGHTYIELFKIGANGGAVTQVLGFYPDAYWKTVTNVDVASKVANDGGHEYNASFTISVNASQFQNALNVLQQNANKAYNINSFNCVDWALGIFNAAGANFSIPKYIVPNSIGTAINTPQGVYNRISQLAIAGNSNAKTNGKAYSSNSKGPCN